MERLVLQKKKVSYARLKEKQPKKIKNKRRFGFCSLAKRKIENAIQGSIIKPMAGHASLI